MKFLKLRMIWAIIKGRTVVFNAEFYDGRLYIRTKKACVINNRFDRTGINDINGKPI